MAKSYRDIITFEDTVTSAEASANAIVINLYDPTEYVTIADISFIWQVRRSGVDIPGFTASFSTTTGSITIGDAGSANLTAGDIITVLFWEKA